MRQTILSVAYPFAPTGSNAVGGAEQMLTALDKSLVAAGHRSIVVACQKSQTRGELMASVPCHEVLSGDLCTFARSEHRRTIMEALDRWPVDVIHMHGVDFYEYLPDTHLPILVTLHLPISFYPADVLQTLPANVRLHCVSRSQAKACPPGLNLLPPIENGVDVHALAARHGKRNFALALGRFCPEKGFHIAVDAAKRANMPLILAGDVFGYSSHAHYWRHELLPRLDVRRRWVGPADFRRKRRLLNAARCLLVPSLVDETSSLVTMEALACGTPVIAFPNGALSEIIDHGTTGFLVRDADEMADAMQRVHELDPEACRQAARRRFSLEKTVARYLDLYRRLASQAQAPALEACRVA